VRRPTLNLSIYEIVGSLFAKSECPIQMSIFGQERAFLLKSVKSIRHRRENGIDTLKLYHVTLLKTLKKTLSNAIFSWNLQLFCVVQKFSSLHLRHF